MALRVVFMGTADFAVPALERLIASEHRVVAVYTQPARPAGRGQQPRPSPVGRVALANRLPLATPVSFKDPAEPAALARLAPDIAVVVAYGLLLPAPVLAIPRLGCCNVHASLLPRWRGAAPIQRAILAGDGETGVSIMQMDTGLDTGPVLLRQAVPIGARATAVEVAQELARLGADLLLAALDGVAAGRLAAVPQAAGGATYAHKIDKSEGRIKWSEPAAAVDRLIRALNPVPGAWFDHSGKRVKVLAAIPVSGRGRPGTVLDDVATVACGEGALRLERLQRPGRAAQPAPEFLRGFALPPGTQLA